MCIDTDAGALGGSAVTGLHQLISELAITVSDQQVWLAIALALLVGSGFWLAGAWIARTVGLLDESAPAGETLGVGLASGLIVIAACWATIRSGGRSSFTPVAIGFALSVGLALLGRLQRGTGSVVSISADSRSDAAARTSGRISWRVVIATGVAAALFVAGVGVLYGATMAPSPRNDLQPAEFADEAYYAVLGRDLAITGVETNLSPSGFNASPSSGDLADFSSQQWYHWAELWLAAAVISAFGTAPIAARCFVVLPLLVLAASALTGTLVRRVTGRRSWTAYAFGFVACLFLTPIPLGGDTPFASWSAGLLFGITTYGIAGVAVVLALYAVTVVRRTPPSWPTALFAGNIAAFILPAHIVVALLAVVGVGAICVVHAAGALVGRRQIPAVSPGWQRTLSVTVVAMAIAALWGVVTGHGVASAGTSSRVGAFGYAWDVAVLVAMLGAGAYFAIPLAWFRQRHRKELWADVYLGGMLLVVVGAILWGARLGDYTMFYFFYGAIAVFATPLAAIAVWSLVRGLRRMRNARLALAVVAILLALQLSLGAASTVTRLQQFGPRLGHEATSVSLLAAIRQLPQDAKLAYSCRSLAEISFVDTSLLSIDAHTGHRVIPLCFQADVFGILDGAPISMQTPASDFHDAPQRALFPNAAADPSPAAVVAFLRLHNIDYIYADATHPNVLVPNALLVARSGDETVLRVP